MSGILGWYGRECLRRWDLRLMTETLAFACGFSRSSFVLGGVDAAAGGSFSCSVGRLWSTLLSVQYEVLESDWWFSGLVDRFQCRRSYHSHPLVSLVHVVIKMHCTA